MDILNLNTATIYHICNLELCCSDSYYIALYHVQQFCVLSPVKMVDGYVIKRAIYHAGKGLSPSAISRALADEGITYSRKSVLYLLRKLRESGSAIRKPGSGRPTKMTRRVKDLIETQMQKDDETTASQLDSLLQANGIKLSRSTILRCRRKLGWTYRGAAYCQQIRDINKQKRLAWCQENLNDNFADVIWTDMTTVQLENHRRFCHRKLGQKPRPKPRSVNSSMCVMEVELILRLLPHLTN